MEEGEEWRKSGGRGRVEEEWRKRGPGHNVKILRWGLISNKRNADWLGMGLDSGATTAIHSGGGNIPWHSAIALGRCRLVVC